MQRKDFTKSSFGDTNVARLYRRSLDVPETSKTLQPSNFTFNCGKHNVRYF